MWRVRSNSAKLGSWLPSRDRGTLAEWDKRTRTNAEDPEGAALGVLVPWPSLETLSHYGHDPHSGPGLAVGATELGSLSPVNQNNDSMAVKSLPWPKNRISFL